MENQQDLLNLIDRRIKLRFLKEKKSSRTYIEGLDKFFDTNFIKEMVKKIQKNFRQDIILFQMKMVILYLMVLMGTIKNVLRKY